MDSKRVDKFRVVCIGGSAGAVSAYRELLSALPGKTDMAFVIVAHRGVSQRHLLLEVLSPVSQMSVIEVKDGMELSPNVVHVMPPAVDMTITKDNHLHLEASSKSHGWPIALTLFLSSLVESVGSRAIAVIFSGMDHDGSDAMKLVKDVGGITFAQSNPQETDMPRNAIETGHVDFILTPAQIAEALVALARVDSRLREILIGDDVPQ